MDASSASFIQEPVVPARAALAFLREGRGSGGFAPYLQRREQRHAVSEPETIVCRAMTDRVPASGSGTVPGGVAASVGDDLDEALRADFAGARSRVTHGSESVPHAMRGGD